MERDFRKSLPLKKLSFLILTLPELEYVKLYKSPPQNRKVVSSRYFYAKSEYEEKQMQKSNKFWDIWEKPIYTSCSEKFH